MLLEFEDCILDLNRRELYRASQVVATTPQVFDLLVFLAENRDRVVSSDDLFKSIWTGRIVSESTLASHINAVRKAVGDNGSLQRVIRTVARKGFRFVADVKEVKTLDSVSFSNDDSVIDIKNNSSVLTLPTKPSIAVLPFVNLSGDQDQDYLADGVVEDIIAGLSQYRWLFVVARNSSFVYKATAVDIKQVGRDLGVRYVLEGSWRKANNRVRVTGQLIDATTGAHHWAGRFESVLEDIFELQDQITTNVIGVIAPELERAEIERARLKPTENLDAYDYYLRGMAQLHRGTKDAMDQALPLFQKAIDFDPDFASAYAMAAWCHCWRKINSWMVDRPQEMAEGIRLARRALELDRGDAVALTRSAHALAHLTNDLQGGIVLLDRALVLNPNLAAAWYLGAFLRVWHGDPDAAIEYFTHAMRLSPLDPEMYRMQAGIGMAYLFKGQFDVSSSWAEKALRDLPTFLPANAILTASYALSGRIVEAERIREHLQQLDTKLCLSNIVDCLPIHRPENLAIMLEGLRRAGLPE
jgi:TolB-like protein